MSDVQVNAVQQLEDDLAVLDIKIGLLINSRAGLDDAVAQSKSISDRLAAFAKPGKPAGLHAGMKALTKVY